MDSYRQKPTVVKAFSVWDFFSVQNKKPEDQVMHDDTIQKLLRERRMYITYTNSGPALKLMNGSLPITYAYMTRRDYIVLHDDGGLVMYAEEAFHFMFEKVEDQNDSRENDTDAEGQAHTRPNPRKREIK